MRGPGASEAVFLCFCDFVFRSWYRNREKEMGKKFWWYNVPYWYTDGLLKRQLTMRYDGQAGESADPKVDRDK